MAGIQGSGPASRAPFTHWIHTPQAVSQGRPGPSRGQKLGSTPTTISWPPTFQSLSVLLTWPQPESSAPSYSYPLFPSTWSPIRGALSSPRHPHLFSSTGHQSNSSHYGAGLSPSQKTAQHRVHRGLGAELRGIHRHGADTEQSRRERPASKNRGLTRGGQVQGFVEPRAGSDPGDHLLWHLLYADGQTEARRSGGGLHRRHSQKVAEPLSCWPARLSLPPGLGHTRTRLSQETGVRFRFLNNGFTNKHQHQGVLVHPVFIPNL